MDPDERVGGVSGLADVPTELAGDISTPVGS